MAAMGEIRCTRCQLLHDVEDSVRGGVIAHSDRGGYHISFHGEKDRVGRLSSAKVSLHKKGSEGEMKISEFLAENVLVQFYREGVEHKLSRISKDISGVIEKIEGVTGRELELLVNATASEFLT